MTSDTQQPRGISRRNVAKGVAWSVPAVVVASAAPAFALSGPPPTVEGGPVLKWPGNSCNNAGVTFADNNKAYLFVFRVINDSDLPIYVYDVDIATNSGVTFTPIDGYQGTTVPAHGSVDLLVWANSSDSGNLVFQATATITWGHSWPTLDTHVPPHPTVTETWCVPGTPTPTAYGLSQCQVAPWVQQGDPPC